MSVCGVIRARLCSICSGAIYVGVLETSSCCRTSAANRVSTARGERERIFSCSWQRAQSGVARRATGFRVRRARSPAGASRTPRGERRCTPLVDTDTIARDDGGSLPRNHARRQHAKQQEDGQTCAEAYTEGGMCRRKCARTRTSMREKLAQVRAHTATSNVEHVCVQTEGAVYYIHIRKSEQRLPLHLRAADSP